MREIKFRGKRKDNGEWVYGYYVYSPKSHSISGTTLSEFDRDTHWIISQNKKYEVIPETVGQYIGRKDDSHMSKNKCIDIYEHDILKNIGDNSIGYVEYNQDKGRFEIYWIKRGYGYWAGFREIITRIVVIGNIFDNSELLNE